MHASRLLAFIALGTLALSLGCQTNPRVARTDSPGEVWVEGHFSNGLEIDGIFNQDGSLDGSPFYDHFFPGTGIKLTNMVSVPSPSGFTRVQATVQNSGRDRERIQYRFIWYDENGLEIGQGTSGWVSETVEAKESRTLEGVARDPDVARFKLFIRKYTPQK